jgi:chain length determinant protein tyrosine kinase EpsG
MGLEIAIQHTEQPAVVRGELSIGAILLDSGRLSVEDAERILRLQRAQKLRFGDAAIKLGLLTEADIQFALSRQFNYPYLQRGSSEVSEEVVAAYEPFSAQVEALRTLRSQLMLRWFDGSPDHKALAIVSPAAKEGRSFLAANLAVVFSQLGERTLLLDADMRQPRQHILFGLENRSGLSAAVSGRSGPVEIHRVPGLRDLSLLPAGAVPPNPIELLSQPLFVELLDELRKRFDVILIDSPPAGQYADAQAIATRARAALVVARKDVTRLSQTKALSDALSQSGAAVVGAVLNAF